MDIVRGIQKRPVMVLIYGPPGGGKSTLASKAGDRVLFCDAEKGTDFIAVDRVRVTSVSELIAFCTDAAKQRENYDTIAFDSLTSIEGLCTELVLKENSWKSLAQPGYGRGEGELLTKITKWMKGMEYLRTAGFNIIILAHNKVRPQNDPSAAESYDRMEFDCAKSLVNPINSAMDATFYMRPRIASVEGRTIGTGLRELVLSDKGGALSKTRFQNLKGTKEFNDESEYTQFWKELLSHV
jgi:hypothetical protein